MKIYDPNFLAPFLTLLIVIAILRVPSAVRLRKRLVLMTLVIGSNILSFFVGHYVSIGHAAQGGAAAIILSEKPFAIAGLSVTTDTASKPAYFDLFVTRDNGSTLVRLPVDTIYKPQELERYMGKDIRAALVNGQWHFN